MSNGDSSSEELQLFEDGRLAFGGSIATHTEALDRFLSAADAAALLPEARQVFSARAAGGDGYSAGATFWVCDDV